MQLLNKRLFKTNGIKAVLVIMLILNVGWAQSGKIIISGVFDGPLPGGTPKGVELFVREDVADLDDYGLGGANNGGGTDGVEFSGMDGSASAGTYIYVSYKNTTFVTWFGFEPDYGTDGSAIQAMYINGDDAVELFYTADDGTNWTVIDVFGDIDTDGTNTDWEYLDSWAKSDPLRTASTTFSISNWIYGGPNALDGESTNAAASTPFPLGGAPIKGNDGFRMMSSPVAGTVYDDILDPLWIQGMTNGDVASGTANIWTYDASTPVWSALGNLNTASLTAGQGFLVQVYSDIDYDDDDDISSSKAIELYVAGQENQATVTISTTASEWNLLGNPFRVTIDADQLFTDNSNYTSTVYVYDDANSQYNTWNGSAGDLSNGLIAPYQGFWIQSGASGTSFQFTSGSKSSTAGTFYKQIAESTGSMSFTITSGDYSDKAFVSFMNNGEADMDNADAYKLLPLTPGEQIVGISYAEENGLDISNLPYSHGGSIAIPLDVMYLTLDNDYNFVTNENEVTMSWDLSNLTETIIGLTLIDNTTNATTDLLQSEELAFTTQAKGSFPAYGSGGVNIYPEVGASHFTLTVVYSALTTNDDMMPKEFALHQAYPNPFNPTATITFDVPAQTHSNASLQIYDITGRLVATLVDEQLAPGTHTLQWQPVNLSSGLYIVQLKAGDQTFNQKITFIK